MTDITMLMTTWIPEGDMGKERLKIEEHCLETWREHLYHDSAIHLHIADDGSLDNDMMSIMDMAIQIWDRGKVTYSRQSRQGVGASLNAGLHQAFQRSPFVLHAVDDWELRDGLDLAPWVQFMNDPEYDVGMVRFFPHPDLTGTIRHIPPHGWAVALHRHHYVFATRPALLHQRFFDALGYFKEKVSALDCEVDFNERLINPTRFVGTGVWLALPEVWRNLDSGSLSAIVPS